MYTYIYIYIYIYSGLLINPSGSFANRPWYVKNKNGHEKVTEKSPRPLNTTVLLEISSRISWKRRFCELENPKIEKIGTRNRKF